VNRQYDARIAEYRVQVIHGPQKHRNKCRLPVVDVENLRNTKLLGRLKDRAAIQPEALGIVWVIPSLGSVKFFPIK
jgi:hypothetical protein